MEGNKMSLWTRGKDIWLRIKAWWSKNWTLIRPGPEVRRGAVWGTLAAAAACVLIGGMYLCTGFGRAFDFAFAILFAALCIPLTALGVALLLTILGKLPRWAAGWVIGSCVVVRMLWGPLEVGIPVAIVVGLVEGVLRSEEHTSELQSPCNLVCRLLLEKKTGSTTTTVRAREPMASG